MGTVGVKYPDSNLRRARYPAAPLVFCLGLSISSLPPPSPLTKFPPPLSSRLPSHRVSTWLSLLEPIFPLLYPSQWVAPSTRRCTRRSSSSAPRKMTRCVTVYFVIFQTHHNRPASLTYETRFGRFLHSASPCSVSIVNKFAQRILRDRSSIFLNALVCAATLTRLSPPSRLPLPTASALPMDTPAPPVARQLHLLSLQEALPFRLPLAR